MKIDNFLTTTLPCVRLWSSLPLSLSHHAKTQCRRDSQPANQQVVWGMRGRRRRNKETQEGGGGGRAFLSVGSWDFGRRSTNLPLFFLAGPWFTSQGSIGFVGTGFVFPNNQIERKCDFVWWVLLSWSSYAITAFNFFSFQTFSWNEDSFWSFSFLPPEGWKSFPRRLGCVCVTQKDESNLSFDPSRQWIKRRKCWGERRNL